MLLFKFKLFILLLVFPFLSWSFKDNECLNANYKVEVVHKGQPFGIMNNFLNISKTQCIIDISHQKLKYISKNWQVDVCRGPVHIKKGSGAVEVVKRKVDCRPNSDDVFCNRYNELRSILQDDGLIFAEGEKEVLSSSHGKVYCSYLLLKTYLERGIVLSRTKIYNDFLENDNTKLLNNKSFPDNEEKPITKELPSNSEVPRPEIDSGFSLFNDSSEKEDTTNSEN